MSCIYIYPPTGEWHEAFGFVRVEDTDAVRECEENWVVWNDIANAAGYILSPIIGIIRIIANAYFLHKGQDCDGFKWDDDDKKYFYAQIGRGCFELIGGGYILWIPDLIKTFCFAKKQDN